MSTPFVFTQQHHQPTNSYAEFTSNIFASPSSTTTMIYQQQPPKGVTGKTHPNDKKPLPDSEYEFRFEVREAGVLPLPRGQHRSRASCDYCRQRHWRCDNQRPTCAHCVKMGVQCTYLNPRKKRGRIPKNAIRTPASASGTPTTTNPKRKTEIETKRPRSTTTKEKTPAKKQKTNTTTPNKQTNKSTSKRDDDDDYEEDEDEEEDEMEEDEDEVVEYQTAPRPSAPHPQLVPSISVTNPNNKTVGNFGGSALNPTSLAAELAGYGFMSQADPNWDELFNENTDTNSGGELQGGRLTTSAIQRILKLSGSRLFSSYNNAPQAPGTTIGSSSFSSLNAPGGPVPLDVPSSPIWLLSPSTPTPNNLSTSAANAAAFAAAAVTISEIMGLSSSGEQRQQPQIQQQQQQPQGQQQLLPPSQPFRGVLGSSGGRYPIRQQTNSSGGWEEESVLSANTLFTDLNASATTPTPSNLLNNSDIAFLRSVLSLSGSNSNAPVSSHPSSSSSTADPSGAGITYSSDQRPLRISSSAERILRLLGVSLGNSNNTNRVERRRQQRTEESGTTATTGTSSTAETEKDASSTTTTTTGTPASGPTSLVDPIAELGVELPSPNITKPTRALANSGIHMRRTVSRVRRSDPDSDPLNSPSLSLSSGDSSSTSTASSAATTPLPPTGDKVETTASSSPSADSPGFEERQQQYGQLRPQQLLPPFKIDTLYAPLGLNGNTEELKVPEDKCNSYLKWFEEHLGLLWNHLAVPPLTSYLKFALLTTNTNLPPPSLLIAEEIQICARLAFGMSTSLSFFKREY
jgi:hypothetical protein